MFSTLAIVPQKNHVRITLASDAATAINSRPSIHNLHICLYLVDLCGKGAPRPRTGCLHIRTWLNYANLLSGIHRSVLGGLRHGGGAAEDVEVGDLASFGLGEGRN